MKKKDKWILLWVTLYSILLCIGIVIICNIGRINERLNSLDNKEVCYCIQRDNDALLIEVKSIEEIKYWIADYRLNELGIREGIIRGLDCSSL